MYYNTKYLRKFVFFKSGIAPAQIYSYFSSQHPSALQSYCKWMVYTLPCMLTSITVAAHWHALGIMQGMNCLHNLSNAALNISGHSLRHRVTWLLMNGKARGWKRSSSDLRHDPLISLKRLRKNTEGLQARLQLGPSRIRFVSAAHPPTTINT